MLDKMRVKFWRKFKNTWYFEKIRIASGQLWKISPQILIQSFLGIFLKKEIYKMIGYSPLKGAGKIICSMNDNNENIS